MFSYTYKKDTDLCSRAAAKIEVVWAQNGGGT